MKVAIKPYLVIDDEGGFFYEAIVESKIASKGNGYKKLIISGGRNRPVDDLVTGLTDYLFELVESRGPLKDIVIFKSLLDINAASGEPNELELDNYNKIVSGIVKFSQGSAEI